MKFFDNVNESKEKKQPVLMRRETMSGSQLPFRRTTVMRRSYNGPFPESLTKGYDQKSEDVSNTYDAMNPNFIFLQFYHSSRFAEDEIPLALPEEEVGFYHTVKNYESLPTFFIVVNNTSYIL